jgi:hypothetical protein
MDPTRQARPHGHGIELAAAREGIRSFRRPPADMYDRRVMRRGGALGVAVITTALACVRTPTQTYRALDLELLPDTARGRRRRGVLSSGSHPEGNSAGARREGHDGDGNRRRRGCPTRHTAFVRAQAAQACEVTRLPSA